MEICGQKWSNWRGVSCLEATPQPGIDDKGRLKVPNAFRSLLESKYGRELFLTSLSGESVRIYPHAGVDGIRREARAGAVDPSGQAPFLDRINYYGQTAELDTQGRVIIPYQLRDAATMTGDVDVLGHIQLPRRLESRSLPRKTAARAVYRRRRAGARGVRDLMTHVPVMTAEILQFLRPEHGGLFVDCTVGLGGHAGALLEAGATRLIGLDRDLDALARAARNGSRRGAIASSSSTPTTARSPTCSTQRQIAVVDGTLADLGVSSMQFDAPGRGFSFQRDEPLDMRMDRSQR